MHTEKRFFSRALMLISVLALIAGCAPTSLAPGQASLGPTNASVAQVQSSGGGAPPVDSARVYRPGLPISKLALNCARRSSRSISLTRWTRPA